MLRVLGTHLELASLPTYYLVHYSVTDGVSPGGPPEPVLFVCFVSQQYFNTNKGKNERKTWSVIHHLSEMMTLILAQFNLEALKWNGGKSVSLRGCW